MPEKVFIPRDKNLLDPRVDSTFKTLFIQESPGAKKALKSLIGAIIGYEPETVEVVNNELPKDIENAKSIRLDLQCRMADGNRINIEMQTCMNGDNLEARSLYYGCRMISGMGMRGKSYKDMPKAYQVMFTDFQLFGEKSDYIQRLTFHNEQVKIENLQLIFIQMPLLEIGDKGTNNLSDIEKWVIFLRDSTDKSKRDLLNEIMSSNEGIREAGGILMTISEDEREWARQESRLKGELDYQSGMIAAHDRGVEEGKLETARGMKAKNIPIDTIIEITGLKAEQVEAL